MAAFIPYFIQAFEALLAAVGSGYLVHQAGGDANATLTAAGAAAIAKLIPPKILPGGKAA